MEGRHERNILWTLFRFRAGLPNAWLRYAISHTSPQIRLRSVCRPSQRIRSGELLRAVHSDYLRIAADSPAAKGGAGGAWPSYIGAFPPGPAPKDGDWFTRLRQRWGNLATERIAPPVSSPLDALNPALIPASERFDWQPKELVAVIGEHRQRHWGDTCDLALSVDGAMVATEGKDGRVRFWDTTTLKACGTSEHWSPWSSGFVVYVPAGPRKGLVWWGVSHPDNRVRLLDPKTGRLDPCGTDWVLTLTGSPGDCLRAFAASSDGRYLACPNQSSVQLWDVSGDKPKRMPSLKTEAEGWNDRSRLSFAPGSNILAYCPSAKEVRLVDLAKADMPEVARLTHKQPVACLAFSKNGRRLAVGGLQGQVTVWELASKGWNRRATFNVSTTAMVHHLDFSHSDKQLAVSGFDKFAPEVWDVEQPQPQFRLRLGWLTFRSTFTSDDRCLITIFKQLVLRWELGEKEAAEQPKIAMERAFPPWHRFGDRMIVSPDGRRLVTSAFNNQLDLWSLDGPQPREIQPSLKNAFPGRLPPPWGAFSPDATLLAIYQSEPPFTHLWDVASPQPRLSGRYKATVNQTVTAWSLDGHRVYAFDVGQQAAGLHVLDASGPMLRRVASAESNVDTRFGIPTRNRLAGNTLAFKLRGEFDGFEVWDVTGEKPRRRALLHKGNHCLDLALSPDGKRLACATMLGVDGITLWNLSGAEPRKLEKLSVNRPQSVCFMPDGRRLVWCDITGRLVLWDLALQGPEREWKLPGVVTQIFAPRDGRHILTYNGNGTIYVLRLAPPPAAVRPPEKATSTESTGRFPPLDPAWLKQVAALPAEKQVDAVVDERKERNPGFDGKVWLRKVEEGAVTALGFSPVRVTDISPVRALVGLDRSLSRTRPIWPETSTPAWSTATDRTAGRATR